MMTLEEQKLAVAQKLPELIEIEHIQAHTTQSPFGDELYDVPEHWVIQWKKIPAGRINRIINWPTEGLQVCHEAEKLLSEDEQDYYYNKLSIGKTPIEEHKGEPTKNEYCITCIKDSAHTTYEQRFEALCQAWWPERWKHVK